MARQLNERSRKKAVAPGSSAVLRSASAAYVGETDSGRCAFAKCFSKDYSNWRS